MRNQNNVKLDYPMAIASTIQDFSFLTTSPVGTTVIKEVDISPVSGLLPNLAENYYIGLRSYLLIKKSAGNNFVSGSSGFFDSRGSKIINGMFSDANLASTTYYANLTVGSPEIVFASYPSQNNKLVTFCDIYDYSLAAPFTVRVVSTIYLAYGDSNECKHECCKP